jgi:hypothetical protein
MQWTVACLLGLFGSSVLASSGLSTAFPEWPMISKYDQPYTAWSDITAFDLGKVACDPDHFEFYRYVPTLKLETALQRLRQQHFLVVPQVPSAYAKDTNVQALFHLVPTQASTEYIMVLKDDAFSNQQVVWLCRLIAAVKSPARSGLFDQTLFVNQAEVSSDDARGRQLIPNDFVDNWYGDKVRCLKRETLVWHQPTRAIDELLTAILRGRGYKAVASDSKRFDVTEWTDPTHQLRYLERHEHQGRLGVMTWCQLEVIGQAGVLPEATAPVKTRLIIAMLAMILIVVVGSLYLVIVLKLDGTIFAIVFVVAIGLVIAYMQFLFDQL